MGEAMPGWRQGLTGQASLTYPTMNPLQLIGGAAEYLPGLFRPHNKVEATVESPGLIAKRGHG